MLNKEQVWKTCSEGMKRTKLILRNRDIYIRYTHILLANQVNRLKPNYLIYLIFHSIIIIITSWTQKPSYVLTQAAGVPGNPLSFNWHFKHQNLMEASEHWLLTPKGSSSFLHILLCRNIYPILLLFVYESVCAIDSEILEFEFSF